MNDKGSAHNYDCAVIGAGPAGLIATLALQQNGLNTICIGPPPAGGRTDRRTTALLDGSVAFLTRIPDLWEQLAPHAEPLQTLRLIDCTGRLFRAPDMVFDAHEIGKEAFGYNIPNADLVRILISTLGHSFLPSAGVTALRLEDDAAYVTTQEGHRLRARLVTGGDGRKSMCRETAQIGVRSWSYDQTAIVCNFSHSRPHNNACTEFHYTNGPFTVVPLGEGTSSLVWVERRETASAFAEMDDQRFGDEITARLEGLLGTITKPGPRGIFPLYALIAKKLTGKRLALIGEAAHVMPPIGAQGLNLGIRDVADLARCIAGQDDPGSKDVLAAYQRSRRADVWIRTMMADILNRTLISNMPILQLARSAGLGALSLTGPLRRAAMRRGMAAANS
jgi:2-octaprenyl-6-methoxyphenol hydroxylase